MFLKPQTQLLILMAEYSWKLVSKIKPRALLGKALHGCNTTLGLLQ